MLHRIFIAIQIIYSVLYFSKLDILGDQKVLGASTFEHTPGVNREVSFPSIANRLDIFTQTAFNQKEITEYDPIPFTSQYVDDEDLEYGKERVEQTGENGVTARTYLVTYWLDEEFDWLLLSTEIEEPTTEVIAVGKKIIWRGLDTPEYGELKYWYKMRVWATKYDSSCEGCSRTTALGAPVQRGVCAVDPTVIKMYTHFYVPGYGKCQALDVGGAVKGDMIDLAYKDASDGAWRTGYTDIYLLDNEPE